MKNSKTNEKIPPHWINVPLGDILLDIVGGGTPSRSNPKYWDGEIPWFTVKDMRSRRPPDSIDHISEVAVRESATNIVPSDTVIIATRIGLGKVIRAPFKAAINQDLKALILPNNIDKGYVEYWIFSIANYIESIGSGTTVKGIRLEQVRSLPFPLAPINEQKRIVAEIEKQFSRLDEAVENLQRVKANLKRYKASVLKSAVEGKLTEQWRAEHPDLEPASQILERILKERRKKWEENTLVKMKAKGKVPKDDKWKHQYKEPSKADESLLEPLPTGWAWAKLSQLGELNRGISKHRPRNAPILYGGTHPFIQTGDVRNATGVIKQYTQTYSEEGLKQSRLWPKNTLCITIAANIADTAILGFDACFPDSIVGFIPASGKIDVRYVEYFLRTAKKDLERYAPATAQKNINLSVLNDVAIPLPSQEEQQGIISVIEKQLTLAENTEIDIAQNLKRTAQRKVLYTFAPAIITNEIYRSDLHKTMVHLGAEDQISIWSIINLESIATGEDLVTLKMRPTIGILPDLIEDLIPEARRGKIIKLLDIFAKDAYRSTPESVIDRARDAASAILGAYNEQNDLGSFEKDLGKQIKVFIKAEKNVALNSADIIRRLHPRAKPSEQERYKFRPISEQDAELAVNCIGSILWGRGRPSDFHIYDICRL